MLNAQPILTLGLGTSASIIGYLYLDETQKQRDHESNESQKQRDHESNESFKRYNESQKQRDHEIDILKLKFSKNNWWF
jgi:hypothetical protein